MFANVPSAARRWLVWRPRSRSFAVRCGTGAAAKAALKLMGVQTAAELAGIIASVGLAQNLAALRALATEGIQRGHMSLHKRAVGAPSADPKGNRS